jgi:hypothetical protein
MEKQTLLPYLKILPLAPVVSRMIAVHILKAHFSKIQLIVASHQVAIGGLLVNVLAIGPKIHGFKSGRGRWILRALKFSSMTSFGWEVKPSVPYCKTLQYVKESYE